jgi:hypothetical protein
MKNYFFEKKNYLVFTVLAIIFMISSVALNDFQIINKKVAYLSPLYLGIFFTGVFGYMIYCGIKDKKLRVKEAVIPKVSTEPTTGPFAKPGNAFIIIDGFKYFIQSPFTKEGAYPKANDTFYSYLAGHRPLIRPIANKMVRWLKRDMKLADMAVNRSQLCCWFKDLLVVDSNNPLSLFYFGNEKLNLIIAIERLKRTDSSRGLEHIGALINAASAYEKAHYAGGGLLDAFDLFKNGEMVPKVFKVGETIGYCFLHKNIN